MEKTDVEKKEERRNLILEGNLLKVIPVIALPQVVTMIIDSLYNLADTYFVSQLGDAATAAVGVNDSVMHIIRALALMFGMGASSYISRLMGAKKDDQASKAASTTLITAMAIIAAISALCFTFASPLVRLLGAKTANVQQYSVEYARWTFLFAPFTAATVCLSQSLRAEGSSTLSMIGSVSGCVVNCFLDPLMISVWGWGVAGAAIATGISKVISAVILFYPYMSHKSMLNISFKNFTPTKDLYSEIARMGIPTGIRTSVMAISSILINNIAGGYGEVALAAVSVSNKCMRFVGSAVMGFGQGFQPIAGFCWGAKKYKRVKTAFKYTSIIGITLGVVLGTLLFIFARWSLGIFSSNENMIDIGMVLIRSQCVVLPAHVWVMISTGLFQGTGKAFQAAMLGLSRQIFALVPAVLIMNYFFGLTGLTYAQAAADVVATALALLLVVPMIKELNRKQAEAEASGERSTVHA